ncbi:phage tail protein [Caenimonas koreensis DSM 17982]|uniref:Phage tail protein n=1 Tax=Caenimonas koreensis DSM 17982 TaxID=1121255 RepID=A0A844B535_9BURK|nr:tail fiber protein [Caenimonas koreensis]MRD48322.1 phage tail protein [Caenimonas koreensis DSM 17982]
MADPFVAEIRIFPFNFAPTGWAFCDGQLLPISQNTALFSLLGTYYGGDGKSTFGLPNMQGNAPMQSGQGPGLSERFLGETGGSATVTLLQSEMPIHNHTVRAGNDALALSQDPTANLAARPGWDDGSNSGVGGAYSSAAPNQPMHAQMLALAGGDQPHNNMQPYLTLNFCIAMQGVFPPRS